MEVILKKDVPGIGKFGAVVKVKDGFARNYLLPNGLGVAATGDNLARLKVQQQSVSLKLKKDKEEAESLKSKLESLSLTIPVLTQEKDKLYGSITAVEICAALKEEGHVLDKDALLLEEPIKSLGIYEVPVKLHPEVISKIKVWIVKK
ncbi:50S ribosomal protein L9 [bacterium]|nr:MAG: 50S ribosomal protein L9 [bacterium]